ncbi:LB_289 family protein [Paraliomyxa miuraensis]|uniref:LB_289 family protein n=1 Tax=Paraliomyxa miuraensis TaxID=376150 RepID=UPI00225AD297|nr:hypothetical protein [Paraliomyxa miuraensis]MCX4242228.1 hypothetical protein [Paraliomyxa miuraensis]
MKRTDMDRIERELKRVQKRQKLGERREAGRPAQTIGAYIKDLNALLRHDGHIIYNTLDDEEILELLENMKEDVPEEKWDTVIRKAVNATKVTERDTAVEQLRSLMAG